MASSAIRLRAAYVSHAGSVRAVNEDAACLVRLGTGALVAAVVDGMGGHGGGDVAAKIAIQSIRQAVGKPLPTEVEARHEWLLEGIYDADYAIRAAGARMLGLGAMGATLVAALVTTEQCLLLHAGDCRGYHFRANGVRFTTTDHSVVRHLIDAGAITEAQALDHPMRSVVSSCLGGGADARLTVDPPLEADTPFHQVEPGDTLLLCSDGLWSEVPTGDIGALVALHSGRPRRLARACVEAALDHGGRDNVTVAVVCRA